MMFEDDEAPEAGASEPGTDWARGGMTTHRRDTAEVTSPPRIIHPPAYRGVVAGWPEDWRERWGRRANDLEEAGLSWRDAEAQAFVEVWNLVRQGPYADASGTSRPDPERN
jgi:hypothetical protein